MLFSIIACSGIFTRSGAFCQKSLQRYKKKMTIASFLPFFFQEKSFFYLHPHFSVVFSTFFPSRTSLSYPSLRNSARVTAVAMATFKLSEVGSLAG